MMLVTGAQGVLGFALLRELKNQSLAYMSVSRGDNADLKWDLKQALAAEQASELKGCVTLIHCAPIWLLPDHMTSLRELGISRVVAFSSTSVISKKGSKDRNDQALVRSLADAEAALWVQAKQNSVELTILRPSMIYGYGRDQNVSHIARRLQRIKIMPLAGAASGLRQPVHADDLAQAALCIVQRKNTYGKTYNVAGGEQLTYREMVARIFTGLGLPPRMIAIPMPIYRAGLVIASGLGGFSYTASMANRMNQDLAYDITDAIQDFEYTPQRFLTDPERDLP